MSITTAQALDCFASDDLIGIGMEADAIRRRIHPENVITYALQDDVDQQPTPAEPIIASLTIGVGESPAQLIDRLEHLRALQAQGASFTAFTLHIAPGPIEPTAVEYLRTLAICRLYLDNIPNIETSTAVGLKVLQMALRFGANDVGIIPPNTRTTEEDIRRIIRDAGFQPHQRDTLYRAFYLN